MTRRSLAGVLAVGALALAACGGSADAGTFTGQVLDPPFHMAKVSLTDTAGDAETLADTDEPLTLVFFGYTHCPDICGLVMSNLAAAMTRLDAEDRSKVQVVFVTTDPARDDDLVLRRYLDHLDPDFEGLTGDLDDIVALGRSVAVGVSDGQKLPSGGYDLNTHSTQVTALLPGGDAPVYWGQETTAAQYAADIHTILDRGVPQS